MTVKIDSTVKKAKHHQKTNVYSSILTFAPNFTFKIIYVIARKEFINKWNDLCEQWKEIKRSHQKKKKADDEKKEDNFPYQKLPTKALQDAISYKCDVLAQFLPYRSFKGYNDLNEINLFITTPFNSDQGRFKEDLKICFQAWEESLAQIGINPLNISNCVNSFIIKRKTFDKSIIINDVLNGSDLKYMDKKAFKFWIISQLNGKVLYLEKNQKVTLRASTEGELLGWDNVISLKEKEKTSKEFVYGFYKIDIKHISIPFVKTNICFLIQLSIFRNYLDKKTKNKYHYNRRSVYIDLLPYQNSCQNKLFQTNKYSNKLTDHQYENPPILKTYLSKGLNPMWDDFYEAIFKNVNNFSFPKPNEVFSANLNNIMMKKIRPTHHTQDGYIHPLKKGAGIFSYGNISIQLASFFHDANILPLPYQKNVIWRGVDPIRLNMTDLWLKDANQKRIPRIIFLIYHNNIFFEYITKILQNLAKLIGKQDDWNIIKPKFDDEQFDLRIGPFRIIPLHFLSDSSKQLFGTGTKKNEDELTQKLLFRIKPKIKNISEVSQKLAFVETNWTGYVPYGKNNTKYLIRRILAKNRIVSQFIDVKRLIKEKKKRKSRKKRVDVNNLSKKQKAIIDNTTNEIFRLFGIQMFHIKSTMLAENSWFFGIKVKKRRKGEWGCCITAFPNNKEEQIYAISLKKEQNILETHTKSRRNTWASVFKTTLDVHGSDFLELKGKHPLEIWKFVKKSLLDFVKFQKEGKRPFSGIVYIDHPGLWKIFVNCYKEKNNKASFDLSQKNFFEDPILNNFAFIYITADSNYVPKIFKLQEENKDNEGKPKRNDLIDFDINYIKSLVRTNTLRISHTAKNLSPFQNINKNCRLSIYPGPELISIYKNRKKMTKHSKYTYPKKEFPTNNPTIIYPFRTGNLNWKLDLEEDEKVQELIKITVGLCRTPMYWKSDQKTNFPLPMHFSHTILEDLSGEIKEFKRERKNDNKGKQTNLKALLK